MVEIRYRDQYEISERAGQTVSEAREQYKAEFGIPNKAQAKLNGSKVKTGAEIDTVLTDDDKLTFVTSHSKGAYLVGALLLALVVTGGVFAAGFINASTTLTATTQNNNFADVTVNPAYSTLTWSAWGFFKGAIATNTSTNGTGIFDINTSSSGYTGDLVVTVSLGNADQLVQRYRALSLQLVMTTPDGSLMDINESGAADANDWVMLTLDNGSVSMYPGSTANITTVRVKKGFFITHVYPFGGWPSGSSASPDLFCEVAQR